MQLSHVQIQSLFSFTAAKGVQWYDLQVELVDHLACSIEEKMKVDASQDFAAALDSVYKDFGLFGFSKVVQEKQTQLQRAARRLWWKEMLAFFTWPRIVLFLLAATALWQLAFYVDATLLMRGFAAVYIVLSVAFLIYVLKKSKTRRKLLLLEFGRSHFSMVVFFYQVFILFSAGRFSRIEFAMYAMIGILFIMASFRLFNNVKRRAAKMYPEAFV